MTPRLAPGLEASLERRPLPQSPLKTPLFAGVEAPVLAFEIGVAALVANVSGLALVPLALTALVLGVLHTGLAFATRQDRRLSLVFGRSFAAPRRARPWPTRAVPPLPTVPTFPRRPFA